MVANTIQHPLGFRHLRLLPFLSRPAKNDCPADFLRWTAIQLPRDIDLLFAQRCFLRGCFDSPELDQVGVKKLLTHYTR